MRSSSLQWWASRSRGFTLLEILVVLVIIGVIAAAATISINVLGSDSELEDQTQRLAVAMTQAKEEAELQGREIGVFVDRTSYEFFLFDARAQTWQPMTGDDFFAARQLPEGLAMRLWLEGREAILKPHAERETQAVETEAVNAGSEDTNVDTNAEQRATVDTPIPQITLLSSGEVNAFELRIEREQSDRAWRIASQLDNSLLAEELRDEP